MMIMKSENTTVSLPIFLNPLEAAILVDQKLKNGMSKTRDSFLLNLLESLNLEISKCVFTDISRQQQYGVLYFKNHPNLRKMRVLIEDVMTICLELETPFYGTAQFIQESRVMEIDPTDVAQGIDISNYAQLRSHKYLM